MQLFSSCLWSQSLKTIWKLKKPYIQFTPNKLRFNHNTVGVEFVIEIKVQLNMIGLI